MGALLGLIPAITGLFGGNKPSQTAAQFDPALQDIERAQLARFNTADPFWKQAMGATAARAGTTPFYAKNWLTQAQGLRRPALMMLSKRQQSNNPMGADYNPMALDMGTSPAAPVPPAPSTWSNWWNPSALSGATTPSAPAPAAPAAPATAPAAPAAPTLSDDQLSAIKYLQTEYPGMSFTQGETGDKAGPELSGIFTPPAGTSRNPYPINIAETGSLSSLKGLSTDQLRSYLKA